MPDSQDNLDNWLGEPVRPMLPPPGTFELIRKRARRRKLRRAALAATAAAAAVAVAVAVPQVLIAHFNSGRLGPVSMSSSAASSPGPTTSRGVSPSSNAFRPTPQPTTVAPPPVPTPFYPSSVTFVGQHTGWVIGQAGVAGQCASPYCTSIARTDNGAASWYGVSAPRTGPPHGAHGVGQIRFLDGKNGWAFGPELWVTHNAGQRSPAWTQIDTHGLRVTALEARGDRVFAVWARCRGAGPEFAAGCTGFTLYSAQAGSDNWAPVAGAAAGLSLDGTASSAALVLTGAAGYLLSPNGVLFSGPIDGTGPWQPVTAGSAPAAVPCSPGAAQPDGQPSQALLAATGDPQPRLALLCLGQGGGGTQAKTLYYSANGGKTWQPGGAVPVTGVATSLSGSPSGALVLATTQGVETAANVASPWRSASGSLPAGGFTYVGMTFSDQGVAVPANLNLHGVWFTHDGGLTWAMSTVR